MNSINLFPTEDNQTLRTEKLKVKFSFCSYSAYMTIGNDSKELTIYLDQENIKNHVLSNINNLSVKYDRDKKFLLEIFKSVVTEINKLEKEERAELESWLVDNFKSEVNK